MSDRRANRVRAPKEESTTDPGTIPDGARRLCAAVDIVGWSVRGTSGTRAEATGILDEVLRLAGESVKVPVDEWIRHPGGDGWLIVFPADIDESAMIATLVRTATTELAAYNETKPAAHRLRVRLSVAQGTLHPTPAGFCDDVTIGVSRLVGSSALRAAVADYPASDLALIVSDDVYRDVIAHERHGLPARSFWAVVASDKQYRAPAWIHVPDRSGGPRRPSEADQTRHAPALSGAGPQWIVGLMSSLLPGWAAIPAVVAAEERIEPSRVREVVAAWRRGCAETVAPQSVSPAFDKERAVGEEAIELTGCGRFRSAFDLIATQLADAPGALSLPCGLARVLVLAEPGRYADVVEELLDWVFVHRVKGPADTSEPLLLRAENLYAIGRPESAVIDLNQLLEVLPEPKHKPGPAALLRLGDCHARLGHLTDAVNAWQRLIAARPARPHAPLRLGYLALAEERPEEAQEHLRRAAKSLSAWPHTDRRTMEHAVLLGQYAAHRANGENGAAEECLEIAAGLLPEDPVTAAEQAIRAAGKGDTQAWRRCTRLAVNRAINARGGIPVLDLLYNTGLLESDRHRQACAAHRERH